MELQEITALKGVTDKMVERAKAIYDMEERTKTAKKAENRFVNRLRTMDAKEIKDYLKDAVAKYEKRQATAAKRKERKKAFSAEMDVLKEKLKEFHKHGLNVESLIEKMDAEIKAKANEKIDAEIAALQAKMEALQAKRK